MSAPECQWERLRLPSEAEAAPRAAIVSALCTGCAAIADRSQTVRPAAGINPEERRHAMTLVIPAAPAVHSVAAHPYRRPGP